MFVNIYMWTRPGLLQIRLKIMKLNSMLAKYGNETNTMSRYRSGKTDENFNTHYVCMSSYSSHCFSTSAHKNFFPTRNLCELKNNCTSTAKLNKNEIIMIIDDEWLIHKLCTSASCRLKNPSLHAVTIATIIATL